MNGHIRGDVLLALGGQHESRIVVGARPNEVQNVKKLLRANLEGRLDDRDTLSRKFHLMLLRGKPEMADKPDNPALVVRFDVDFADREAKIAQTARFGVEIVVQLVDEHRHVAENTQPLAILLLLRDEIGFGLVALAPQDAGKLAEPFLDRRHLHQVFVAGPNLAPKHIARADEPIDDGAKAMAGNRDAAVDLKLGPLHARSHVPAVEEARHILGPRQRRALFPLLFKIDAPRPPLREKLHQECKLVRILVTVAVGEGVGGHQGVCVA